MQKQGSIKVLSTRFKHIVNEIPNEWESAKISEVTTVVQSGISRLLSPYDIGYVMLTSENIQNSNFEPTKKKYWYKIDDQGVDLNKYILDEGDIILNFINSSAQIGKSCIFKKQERDWIFTTNVFRIRTDKNKIIPEFFHKLLQTKFILKQILAITQPAINQASFSKTDFSKVVIYYPTLKEQQKTASILSNVDELIQKTDQIIEQTQRLKKALMQRLLTKGVGHTKFKKTELGEIPQEWEIQKVNFFLKVIMGQSPSSEFYNEDRKGLPFFQGVTDFGDMFPTPRFWCSSPQKIANENEILFSVRAPVGEVNIAKEKCCIGRGVASLKPITSDLRYCFYLIKLFKHKFTVYSQGTTFEAINKEEIEGVRLPFTSNIKEQQKTATILSNVDSQIQKQQEYKSKLETLKKGLMQELLTGQIRVKV